MAKRSLPSGTVRSPGGKPSPIGGIGGGGMVVPVQVPKPSPSHGSLQKAPPKMHPVAMPSKDPNCIY